MHGFAGAEALELRLEGAADGRDDDARHVPGVDAVQQVEAGADGVGAGESRSCGRVSQAG
nr:hypothetical protein GCM10025732_55850 [Glycomyces mayteni]